VAFLRSRPGTFLSIINQLKGARRTLGDALRMPQTYRNDLTADKVRELLDYDPDTGISL
jgi:hypothetical protein